MVTYEQVRRDEAVRIYIQEADRALLAQGYTEHSFAHVTRVAEQTRIILSTLGFSEREIELACIAAYLHDIGNLVNRVDHSQSGAIIAFRLLEHMGMKPEELATVVSTIGNHDEGTGVPIHPLAAALILADKSDVRSTRVRNNDPTTFDIHDRVNASVTDSSLVIDKEGKRIELHLTVNTRISPVMDYFEIFLERMMLCRKAANTLDLTFGLVINGHSML